MYVPLYVYSVYSIYMLIYLSLYVCSMQTHTYVCSYILTFDDTRSDYGATRSLLPYNRSRLPYDRSLLPYSRSLLTLKADYIHGYGQTRSLLPYNRSLL